MKVWSEFNDISKMTVYRYENNKGLISLIPPQSVTFYKWEIYCLEGGLFEDVERFDSKEEAEIRIKEILGETI